MAASKLAKESIVVAGQFFYDGNEVMHGIGILSYDDPNLTEHVINQVPCDLTTLAACNDNCSKELSISNIINLDLLINDPDERIKNRASLYKSFTLTK